MKKTINLLAEVLALPYSDWFNQTDPIAECVAKKNICKRELLEGKRIADLDKELSKTSNVIANYLNQFLEIPNLTLLQGMIHYVFKGKDIVACVEHYGNLNRPRSVTNQYYVDLLMALTERLLTIRNGSVVLKLWDNTYEEDILHLSHGNNTSSINVETFFSPMRVELWNSLLRCFSEDLFLSSYAAIQAKDTNDGFALRRMTLRMLLSFGEHVCLEDTLLDNVLSNGLAETHLHAGASRTFGLIWENMIYDSVSFRHVLESEQYFLSYKPDIREQNLRSSVMDAAAIRMILADYLGSGEKNMEAYFNHDYLSERYQYPFYTFIRDLMEKEDVALELASVYDFTEPLLKDKSFDLWKILSIPHYYKKSCPSLAERCFLTWSMCHIQRAPEDQLFTALFMYYLRKKQHAYRLRVQDGKNKGLDYFQQYYNLSTDRGSMDRGANISSLLFTALEDHRVVKTEFRFSPPGAIGSEMSEAVINVKGKIKEYLEVFIKEHMFALVLKYSEEYLSQNPEEEKMQVLFDEKWRLAIDNILAGCKGELQKLLGDYAIEIDHISPHRMGIIYHLIKKGETAERESCFARKALTEKERYELFDFGKARFGYEAAVTAISNLRNESPEISRLIVGIDAASKEIPTEPWVFAPAFRMAERQNEVWGIHEKDRNRKPFLGKTYHVGEDFRHPISGLRHIHEAVCGLGLHPGDRIGHGFALGMDIGRWFEQNGLVVMPRIERMENNLWIWHLITAESSLSDIAKHADMIEKQILDDARAIYKDLHGITVNNLYHAYSRKMLPETELFKAVEDHRNHLQNDCTTCFRALETASFFPCWTGRHGREWHEDMLLLSYHCELFKQRMNESIMVAADSAQREIAEFVQRYMLEMIAANGIIVETNPSSNTVIGEMDGILSHPVWHLRENKNCKVMATINTDDPSVFNATVANEHAQVYYAMLYRGLTVEAALQEVNQMRETALSTSFITSPASISDMLSDYEMIIKHIKKY